MRNPLAFLALLPSLLFAASPIWDGTADTDWYNESETEFTITTAEQLAGLAQLGGMRGKTIKLGNDIVLNDTTNWRDWATSNSELKQWTPINGFSGTFDGDGYTISGVYINTSTSASASDRQGLFGYTGYNSGMIKNLGVVASYIKGAGRVGGLVGHNEGGTITNSYTTGNVEVASNNGTVGGLVGYNQGGTISNSYATGNVEGASDAGGLVGDNVGGTISNSYAIGNVEGADMVGGLVGYNGNGTISNSYAIGNVKGIGAIGGLVGYKDGNNTVTNSYYNTETSGQSDAGKGEGKTTAQMQSKTTYNGWDFNKIWDIDDKFNNKMPYFQWQNTMRQVQVEPIEPQLYTGSQIKPRPKVTAPDGKTELIPGTDFDYSYGENIHVASGGTVYIVSKTNAYYGTKPVDFIIKPSKTVNVHWYPECGTIYTYNGEQQGPTPYAAEYEVKADLETNAAIGITAIATLETPDDEVVLQNASCSYTIAPKILTVSWTPDSVFTYNKMTQAPMPSIASEPSIKLLRHNAHAAAGAYKNEDAASAEIEDQEQARNYTLTNRTKNYEILKKDLKPYFTDTLPNFSTNKSDTLWVPYEVFNDSASLHSVLNSLIDYDGFATDDKGDSDDASVLRGTPKVTLQYIQTSPFMLSKRVETSQKATATIVTEEVSADNYALVRSAPSIVIMATIEEDENADKIFCRLGNNCVEFSEAVCLAVSGQVVETCEIKVACVINGVCVPNTLLETCSLVGETVPTCDEVPIFLRTQPAATPLQSPTYYNLKGEPLGKTKPTAAGVYIEKSGKSVRKTVVR